MVRMGTAHFRCGVRAANAAVSGCVFVMQACSPSRFFAASPHGHLPLRQAIDQAARLPEPQAVQALLAEALRAPAPTHATQALALQLAAQARAAQAASCKARA